MDAPVDRGLFPDCRDTLELGRVPLLDKRVPKPLRNRKRVAVPEWTIMPIFMDTPSLHY
jgi:hypothetical protein